MAKRDWAGLVGIDVVSGTAQDGPTEYRGFVTIRAEAEDGSFMSGQLSPGEVRAMALQFLEAAEAADQDAIVFKLMTREMDVPVEVVGAFVMSMRRERE